MISKIYEFTEEICGADKVILYAVPKARNFYEKNGFVENLSNKRRNAKHTISMRKDIFE